MHCTDLPSVFPDVSPEKHTNEKSHVFLLLLFLSIPGTTLNPMPYPPAIPPATMASLAFAPSLSTRPTQTRKFQTSITTPYPRQTLRRTTFLGTRPQLPALPAYPRLSHSTRQGRPRSATMSLQNVVIAGGTGFIGRRLTAALLAKGASVTVLTRFASSAAKLPQGATARVWAPDKRSAVGNDWLGWQEALAGADLVVNLCGEPVVTRWNDEGRRAIVHSRVSTTNALVEAIKSLPSEKRPRCMASPSAVGYYGVSPVAEFDEAATAAKDDFLADVCVQWEKAAVDGLRTVPETRLVIVRIGVVMGVGGGALERMLPVFKMFMGGPVGSGQQWVSWVHIDDVVRVFIRAGEDASMQGVYNATSPKPVTMGQLSGALAGALGRPNMFPVPGFVLQAVYGDAASVVLDGQKVLPKRLLGMGFKFEHADIDSAMKAVAKEA